MVAEAFLEITEQQVKRTLLLHPITNGNAAKARRISLEIVGREITEVTLLKRWKEAGYPINPRGGRRVSLRGGQGALAYEEIKNVIGDHGKFLGVPRLADRFGEYSYLTYRKYWEEAGLPINRLRDFGHRKLED